MCCWSPHQARTIKVSEPNCYPHAKLPFPLHYVTEYWRYFPDIFIYIIASRKNCHLSHDQPTNLFNDHRTIYNIRESVQTRKTSRAVIHLYACNQHVAHTDVQQGPLNIPLRSMILISAAKKICNISIK